MKTFGGTSQTNQAHAIVIGGGIAGLLAARALSDFFTRVTLIERDLLVDTPAPRKGAPQSHQFHLLLAKGQEIIDGYFPGLITEMVAGGAVLQDLAETGIWHHFGGYKKPHCSGLQMLMLSRPYLEWHIRRRVLALVNVDVMDNSSVQQLLTTADRTLITGLVVERRGEHQHQQTLTADLVIDASGRGSALPKWLEQLGYERPAETRITARVAYSSRMYHRRPDERPALYVASPAHRLSTRMGSVQPIEGDRWMAVLGGWLGDDPPGDEGGFLDFARSLPAPDIYNLLRQAEPVSEIKQHKFPHSLRRHYERMARFPAGLLVIGDAVTSFNPYYGQGMTSAALQAQVLEQSLRQVGISAGLWPTFYRAITPTLDTFWQLAAGEDLRLPAVEGERPPLLGLLLTYSELLHRAAHHDPVAYSAFLRALHVLAPATSLYHPRLVLRVLWTNLRHRSGGWRQSAAGKIEATA